MFKTQGWTRGSILTLSELTLVLSFKLKPSISHLSTTPWDERLSPVVIVRSKSRITAMEGEDVEEVVIIVVSLEERVLGFDIVTLQLDLRREIILET